MKKYIRLMRLDKPIGIFLLFWPCAWGLALANVDQINNLLFIKYLILFFIGSILMRSAGCVYNDIVDRKIDIKIARTQNRPIATGLISLSSAWILILILVSFSLIILFQFNLKSIIFGLSSAFLVLLYPFMKRITYWPQLFLGLTFNWGIILGWLVMKNEFSPLPFILYLSAALWTLGYDTIYGLQDIKDDLMAGIKSTSIKFQKKIKPFLFIVYFLSFALILLVLSLLNANLLTYIFSLGAGAILLYQVINCYQKNSLNYSRLFTLNTYYGLSIFILLLLLKNNA
jgi:4-hydroxybenzoate polyprenyltransferase